MINSVRIDIFFSIFFVQVRRPRIFQEMQLCIAILQSVAHWIDWQKKLYNRTISASGLRYEWVI